LKQDLKEENDIYELVALRNLAEAYRYRGVHTYSNRRAPNMMLSTTSGPVHTLSNENTVQRTGTVHTMGGIKSTCAYSTLRQ